MFFFQRHEYLGHISRLVTTDVTEQVFSVVVVPRSPVTFTFKISCHFHFQSKLPSSFHPSSQWHLWQGFLALLTAFKLGYCGLLTGPTATGKSSLPRELASYLGAMYRVSWSHLGGLVLGICAGEERLPWCDNQLVHWFPQGIQRENDNNNSEDKDEVVLQGVASSGCWAVIEDLDRAPPEVKLFIPAVFTQTDILLFTIPNKFKSSIYLSHNSITPHWQLTGSLAGFSAFGKVALMH